MTKSKNTKRALLAGILSVMVCMAMLIGSTLAWFTDSVTSGKNKIVAGNLDVGLYHVKDGEEIPVTAETNLFLEGALWEPGHVEVVNLKVANLGTLALQYRLGIHIAAEKDGTNAAGDPFRLSDHIRFALIDGNQTYATREDAIAAAEATAVDLSALAVNENGILYPTAKATEEKPDSRYVTLVVYMPATVGNEANYKAGTEAPEIDLGVTLVATQTPYENDSFNEQYDKDATLPDVVVSGTSSLIEAVKNAESGAVIQLAAGTYENVGEIPVDKDLTLIGEDGTTVTDIVVQIKENANVVIENIAIEGGSYIHNQGMKSLTMKGCDVNVTVPKKVNNGGRASFIALGDQETNYGVKLDIQGNTFRVKSSVDNYPAAIFGWAYVEDGSVIRGNTFGSEDSRYNFIAVKLMNFVDGANIEIDSNTVYGTNRDYGFYAFDMYQNNSRANRYTATFTNNTINVEDINDNDTYFIDLEANGTGNANIVVGSGNTFNGSPVTSEHILIEQDTAGNVTFQ